MQRPVIVNAQQPVDLTRIAFERITDEYSWGQYGDFRVIMDKRGYINGSYLCKLTQTDTGNAKRFGSWYRLDSVKTLIAALAASAQMCADTLVVDADGAPNELRGKYVHPDLVPHIAAWASPEFAIKVSRIVNAYLVQQVVDERNRAIAERERMLADKDVVISAQVSVINELRGELRHYMELSTRQYLDLKRDNVAALGELKEARQEIGVLLDDNTSLHCTIDTTSKAVDEANAKLDAANAEIGTMADELGAAADHIGAVERALLTTADRLEDAHAKIDVIVEQRVPPAKNPALREIVRIYAKPVPRGGPRDEMVLIRVQARSLNAAINTIATRGYTRQVASVDPTPNATDVGLRFMEGLKAEMTIPGSRVLMAKHLTFELDRARADRYRWTDIAARLYAVNDEKRDV